MCSDLHFRFAEGEGLEPPGFGQRFSSPLTAFSWNNGDIQTNFHSCWSEGGPGLPWTSRWCRQFPSLSDGLWTARSHVVSSRATSYTMVTWTVAPILQR